MQKQKRNLIPCFYILQSGYKKMSFHYLYFYSPVTWHFWCSPFPLLYLYHSLYNIYTPPTPNPHLGIVTPFIQFLLHAFCVLGIVVGSQCMKKTFILLCYFQSQLISSWVWWYIPIIPALRGLKKEDYELEVSLGYMTHCFN
jgi:hypothetical protein